MFWACYGEYRGRRDTVLFLRYCGAKLREDAECFAVRAYLTEAAMILTENTRRFAGGRRMTKRWVEVVGHKTDSGRSGDEIAAEVIERAKLRVKRAACGDA